MAGAARRVSAALVRLDRRGGIAIVTIDRPPVNALSAALRGELLAVFTALADDATVSAVVLACAGRTFVAGADIAELGTPAFAEADLNVVCHAIEGLDKPVVGALHGTALGGGMDLALACHLRVATATACMGLPEITLGLLPGAGGTQRLPRLVGAERALALMLRGTPVDAGTALTMGLVDAVVEDDPVAAACRVADDWLAQAAPARHTGQCAALRRTSRRAVDAASVPGSLFADARRAIDGRAYGTLAPARIIDCVEKAVNASFAEGLAFERACFTGCLHSAQSIALRHAFRAEREAAHVFGLPDAQARRPVDRVGVVGAGTMGRGIAMAFADAGIPVLLVEVNEFALARGLGALAASYEAMAARGRITAAQRAERTASLRGSLDYTDLRECDLVIEAVVEDMAVKRSVMQCLGDACKTGAIIATNTSTLDVDLLAAATARPADVLGMHFFSPANVMRLLEVVRGRATDLGVLATAMALARRIGKVAVMSGVCDGFIGNRMLEPYLREAEYLLLEGATPAQVDAALEAFGMAMGPCRMIDLAGMDVAASVLTERDKAGRLPPDPAYRVACRALAERGRLGQKAGAGYYRYNGRTPVPDPEVDAILAALGQRLGVRRRDTISDTEIVERCLYPLINEGARILEEGIACRAGDIDVVWLRGFGFPAVKGGPMHLAAVIGLPQLEATLARYARTRGNTFGYWTPAALLRALAASNGRFEAGAS
jgi:3-hydroxyacyl-CoA dehydrogenase